MRDETRLASVVTHLFFLIFSLNFLKMVLVADIFVWAEAILPPDETLYYFMLDEVST